MTLSVKHAGNRTVLLVLLLYFSAVTLAGGQDTDYKYFYRITFTDKGDYTTADFSPSELLSPRAVERRVKAGISVPDFQDLPVFKSYLDQMVNMGLKLHCTSKWMNSALFKSTSPADIAALNDLPFVNDIKLVKSTGLKSQHADKTEIMITATAATPYDLPITMLNGSMLHNSGFNGNNIIIAILDGGFVYADIASSLNNLRDEGRIMNTRDFVNNTGDVYNASEHGTAVLSVLAGNIPGVIEGTAPSAGYLLLKTEDVVTEFPCEEDFWVAGAEFADSCGADIISSSLGYFTFDDPSMNYKISNLDGKTAFITRAAEIAASKGILVVNSAGNERNKTWKYIIFPSDGEDVLAAGAVDGNGMISSFSSAGPTSDGRIKPDNVALGVSVPLQVSPSSVSYASGTSFSCPILSGMSACLMQAVPEAKASDITDALRKTADRSLTPDSLYGFGIPDMLKALSYLQDKYANIPDEGIITAPNPTTGNLRIIFSKPPSSFTLEIISLSGKVVYKKDFSEFAGKVISLDALQNREQGIYFVRVTTPGGIFTNKVIKLRY
ncbi:MAG TPA: S8 family serine peptidase [Bacteroidales bacterium]|nr:S8 family serine peptidase [Bacteroidales bacterium]